MLSPKDNAAERWKLLQCSLLCNKTFELNPKPLKKTENSVLILNFSLKMPEYSQASHRELESWCGQKQEWQDRIKSAFQMKLTCSRHGSLDGFVFRKNYLATICWQQYAGDGLRRFHSSTTTRYGQRCLVHTFLAATQDLASLVVPQLLSWNALC